MRNFVANVLIQSGIPISAKRLWQYAVIFWAVQAIISYVGFSLTKLFHPSEMSYTAWTQWVIHWGVWILFTPALIYVAHRFPFRQLHTYRQLLSTCLTHIAAFSLLSLLGRFIEYLGVMKVHIWETSTSLPWYKPVFWFFYSFDWGLALYLLVVVTYNVVSYSYRYQTLQKQHLDTELANAQLKTQLSNAQLQALKMQLNPHFLFNTHHAIVSLMLQHDNRKAIDMVMALSDLLRGVLAHQDDNFLSLREEIKLTQQYLTIQQIRFQDRLQIEFDISQTAEDCQVPQLILQPLVENAITHGIVELTEGALIRIAARRVADQLLLEVYDNGLGSQPKKKKIESSGLGLSNTRLRLQQAYGEQARLTFAQPPGNGTTVALTLPCNCHLTTTKYNDALPFAYH